MIFHKFAALLLMGVLGELYLFVKVASWIGFLPMVLLAVATTMLGVVMLRMQGAALLEQLGLAVTWGELSTAALLEGGMAWISAILLIVPGFFTDAPGFLCLIPAVRRGLARRLLLKHGATEARAARSRNAGPRTIAVTSLTRRTILDAGPGSASSVNFCSLCHLILLFSPLYY